MVKASDSQQSRKKLISSVINSHTKIVPPVQCFQLKSSTDFASRSVNIFSNLNTIENKHTTWISDNETHESFEDGNNFEPVQKTSDVFKKPFAPATMKRKGVNVSHNRRNMKKWIKYSLADIPLSSDATNTAVALQFLSELRKKREEEETKVSSSTDDKIAFCKPKIEKLKKIPSTHLSSCSELGNEKSISGDNYHCSSTVSCSGTKSIKPNIKLAHLQDDDS